MPHFNEIASKKAFLRGVADVFDDPQSLPDLTITINWTKFHCHKLVMCIQSGYFREECRRDLTMAYPLDLYIREDDPILLMQALKFCYTFTYPTESDQTAEHHLNMCAMAQKYKIDSLESCAIDKFAQEAKKLHDRELWGAVKSVYTEFPGENCVLREIVSSIVVSRAGTMLGADVYGMKTAILNIPHLKHDLVKGLREKYHIVFDDEASDSTSSMSSPTMQLVTYRQT